MIGRLLFATALAAAEGSRRITIGQIEQRLRSLQGGAEQAAEAARKPGTLAVAAGGGVAVLAVAYLLGRRRGKRRSTVLEIRRV